MLLLSVRGIVSNFKNYVDSGLCLCEELGKSGSPRTDLQDSPLQCTAAHNRQTPPQTRWTARPNARLVSGPHTHALVYTRLQSHEPPHTKKGCLVVLMKRVVVELRIEQYTLILGIHKWQLLLEDTGATSA